MRARPALVPGRQGEVHAQWTAMRLTALRGHPRYVTVTVPEEPRNVLRANQRDGYANFAPAEPKTHHLSQLAFLQR
jgi:hypothetical protein